MIGSQVPVHFRINVYTMPKHSDSCRYRKRAMETHFIPTINFGCRLSFWNRTLPKLGHATLTRMGIEQILSFGSTSDGCHLLAMTDQEIFLLLIFDVVSHPVLQVKPSASYVCVQTVLYTYTHKLRNCQKKCIIIQCPNSIASIPQVFNITQAQTKHFILGSSTPQGD